MSDWPVGLSTGCFYQTSFFDCIEAIREGGFGMVEICSFPRHLDYRNEKAVGNAADRLGELGMEAYSFHAPFADDIDITALEEGARKHALDELLRAAQAAAKLQVRHFVIHPGPEKSFNPDPKERADRLRHAAEALEQVAERCQELGIGLVLENMLPHLLFGNIQDMLWIMGGVKSVNLGTCLDTGHAYLSGELGSIMYKLSGHLELIHANDNGGDGDDHLPPGTGKIDWHRLLAELSRTGFDGSLILELAGSQQKSREEILAEARKARLHLRGIAKELDLSSPPTVSTPHHAPWNQ